jgi:hypothetical protein
MSANAVRITEIDQESLTERMARGRLSLAETLRYATQIAASLRDLHVHGLAYGAVSSQLILLGPSGAALRITGGLTHFGERRHDVTAFGGVLGDMIRGVDGPEGLLAEVRGLAMRCQEEAPDMQQVLIALRLLGLRSRLAATAVRKLVSVRRPEAAAKRDLKETVRLRLHLALRWKPLANLAAFALSGK